MNQDEFAFVNRQLAGMLQSGIPLEGALRQLCQGMRKGTLRAELTSLEQDLSSGAPLEKAISARHLPPFYTAMIKVGVASNHLPAVLILLADYYEKLHSLWSRLKGLMVYPGIVLLTSLALSVLVAIFYGRFMRETVGAFHDLLAGTPPGTLPGAFQFALNLWLPVGVLFAATGLVAAALSIPGWRRRLRWRLPAFREAGLSQVASALALMLGNGVTLKEALELLRHVETGSPAERELEHWLAQLATGHKRFNDIASGGKVFPPMFVWIVAGSGEDWVSGFRSAAEIYYARAMHRIEMGLYAVFPASILALGLLIIFQVVPVARVFVYLLNLFSIDGG